MNDGSTDNSESIIRKYCEKDDRVKVINQKNLGVSEARNTGISNATGEFVTFVNPDTELREKARRQPLLKEPRNLKISL